MKPPRDRQRSRVYAWEWCFRDAYPLLHKDLTDSQIESLFYHFCDIFHLKDVELHLIQDIIDPYQRENGIFFGPVSQTVSCLVHEFAHLLVWDWCEKSGKLIEPHGPEFISVYIVLLSRCCQIPLQDMLDEASRRNVRHNRKLVEKYGNRQA